MVDAGQLEPFATRDRESGVDAGEANPRFIVTSLPADVIDGARLYEKVYCQRGEMENRIKECQLDLLAAACPRRRCAPTSFACGSRAWPTC